MTSTSADPAGTVFIVPGDLPGPSGGSRYNEALARALEATGHPLVVVEVPGPWPRPRAKDMAALDAALASRPQAVVDGLIASAAPAQIQRAASRGVRVHILFHLSLAADCGLPADESEHIVLAERDALHAAATVICTSHWAASDVVERYGPLPTRVLLPGTDPAPLVAGSTPPQLLVLASITPRKNQLTILRALAAVAELEWTALFVGPDAAEPAYARQVRGLAARCFEPGRVEITGPRDGKDLEAIWSATDLLLLVSHAETFGMVVTEAAARGIAAVVGSGTGAEEALTLTGSMPTGAAVDPADPAALAAVLRGWLTEPGLRASWRQAAAMARDRLPTWNQTAHGMLGILQP